MPKPIARRQHAFTDNSYVPLVAAAPQLITFEAAAAATDLCHVLSGRILVYGLFTVRVETT